VVGHASGDVKKRNVLKRVSSSALLTKERSQEQEEEGKRGKETKMTCLDPGQVQKEDVPPASIRGPEKLDHEGRWTKVDRCQEQKDAGRCRREPTGRRRGEE